MTGSYRQSDKLFINTSGALMFIFKAGLAHPPLCRYIDLTLGLVMSDLHLSAQRNTEERITCYIIWSFKNRSVSVPHSFNSNSIAIVWQMLLLLVEDSFQLRCVVNKSEVLSRILVCAPFAAWLWNNWWAEYSAQVHGWHGSICFLLGTLRKLFRKRVL